MYWQTNSTRRGMSLTEVVVSTLLVGTVVVGSLATLGTSVRTQAAANDFITGPLLAEALLGEIMSMPFNDPEDGGGSIGTNAGESSAVRGDFDDVDDYDGWSPAAIQDRQGNALTRYAGWTRGARVKWADRINGNEWFLYNTGLKRIRVQVTAPDGTVTTRFGFRSVDGSLEQPDTVDKTVVTQVETTLTVGGPTDPAYGVTNLMNHVEDPN